MRTLLAIGAAALGVRAAYVIVQERLALFDVSFVAADSALYLALARSIAEGHGMVFDGRPTAYVGPGYPLFLAPLVALGAGPTAIGLVQALLGAATAVIAGLLTQQLASVIGASERWSARAGLASALIAAVYPHLVFWTGYVLSETLFVFLVALALLLTVQAVRGGPLLLASAAGLASAAAALTRPAYVAVFGACALLWLLGAVRGRFSRAGLVAFATACAVVFGVWTARNAVELGAPIPTVTESGFVFYQGNSATSTGGTTGYVDARDFAPVPAFDALPEVPRDRAYLERALADVAADPLAAVRRWPAKVWNMWRPTYEGASLRNGLVTIASYLPVLALGMVGAFRLARCGLGAPTVPTLALVVWFAAHVVVSGMIRFRLPAELVLITAAPFAFLPAPSPRPTNP